MVPIMRRIGACLRAPGAARRPCYGDVAHREGRVDITRIPAIDRLTAATPSPDLERHSGVEQFPRCPH
jgi:hypothetical protein